MPRWPKLTTEQYVDKWAEKLDNGCWRYKGIISNWGYGRHAHFYKILTRKTIPKGYELDHLCRNKTCVNPDHLEAVPQSENIRRGKVAKLNKESVSEIISLYAMGLKQVALAEMYNVKQCNISRVINGLRWA